MKARIKTATKTGRWSPEESHPSNFPRGRPLAEVFAAEEAHKDATSNFLRDLLQTDQPSQRSVNLPEEWPCALYDETKATKAMFPVGPENKWMLEIRTHQGNCGTWIALLQLTVPLVTRSDRTIKSIYDASVNGAGAQTKAIEAVVAAGRIAGFIRP